MPRKAALDTAMHSQREKHITSTTDDVESLNAAQLRVAEALHERLGLEFEDADEVPIAVQQSAEGGKEDEDAAGVRLFSSVPAGVPFLDRACQEGSQQPPSTMALQQDGWRAKRCLDPPTEARCQAAAVEAAEIVQAAAAAVQRASATIASPTGWMPADDDPSRWSHRRKRRAAKLAAEAAAWRSAHPVHTHA
ncbi:hypothetical protein ACK3TF_003108 [Chlorella vulgaris]